MRPAALPALLSAVLLALAPLSAGGQEYAPSASDMRTRIESCLAAAPDRAAEEACVGPPSDACVAQPGQDATYGIMTCKLAEAEAWDAILNVLWPRLRARAARADAAGDAAAMGLPGETETLLAAQRAWIAFRDAECAWDYARWGAGSMRQVAGAHCRLRLASARALDFRDALREGG